MKYMSEQWKEEEIVDIEHAKRVIIATAMARFHNKVEILEDGYLIEVAKAFGVNLNDIEVEASEDYRDFPFTYRFE